MSVCVSASCVVGVVATCTQTSDVSVATEPLAEEDVVGGGGVSFSFSLSFCSNCRKRKREILDPPTTSGRTTFIKKGHRWWLIQADMVNESEKRITYFTSFQNGP